MSQTSPSLKEQCRDAEMFPNRESLVSNGIFQYLLTFKRSLILYLDSQARNYVRVPGVQTPFLFKKIAKVPSLCTKCISPTW